MAEIDFEESWRDIIINLAADDERLRSIVQTDESQKILRDDIRNARLAHEFCKYYGLDTEDLADTIMLCEQRTRDPQYGET